MNPNATAYLTAYSEVLHHGRVIAPRGQECLEVCDYKLVLNMKYSVLTSFDARKLNLNYAKQEFLWYLRGNRRDQSIEQYATMWAKIRQEDGGYNSNYGQYIFNKQFNFVVDELVQDPFSRRASIVLLNSDHLYHENTDVVCTYSMNFRIRNNQLDMTVMMRSNDVIFGLTNDAFCFTMVYRMVFAALRDKGMDDLQLGEYTHIANSLHVYKRHFEMIKDIIDDGLTGYHEISMPFFGIGELPRLMLYRAMAGISYTGEKSDDVVRWLSTP